MGKDMIETMILMYERLSAADNNGLFNETFLSASPAVTSKEEVVVEWRGDVKDRVGPIAIRRRNGFDCGIITPLVKVEQPDTQIKTTTKNSQINVIFPAFFELPFGNVI